MQNNAPIHIIADDREQKSDVIDSLAGCKNVNVCIRRLSIGDFLVDKRLIIERKTLKEESGSYLKF